MPRADAALTTAGGQISVKPFSRVWTVEEEVDEGALQAGPGTAVDGEARPGDLGAALELEDAEALGDLPVRPPLPRLGGRVRADLTADGLDARQLVAPGPDGDARVGVPDRDIRVRRVRDPEERVLQLRLHAPDLHVERRDPLAGRDRRGAECRDLGTVGRRALLDRFADLPRRRVALRLAGVRLAEQRAPPRIERERRIDQRRVLALVERAPADDLRLVPKPLQPDAHPAASAVSIPPEAPGSPLRSAMPGAPSP